MPPPAVQAPAVAAPSRAETQAPVADAMAPRSKKADIADDAPVVRLSSDPERLAQDIQTALRSRGVQARIATDASGTRLEADIDDAQRAALQNDLWVFGVEVPRNGKLRLILRRP